MSVKDMNRKLYVKSSVESTPSPIRIDELPCTITLPLWQVNLLEKVIENLDNDYCCEVFYGFLNKYD